MGDDRVDLDESRRWEGMWWLPDEQENPIPGILHYRPGNGLELSLIGAFEDRITSTPAPGVTAVHEGHRTWDVIHGAAEHREITLLGCIPTGGLRTYGARVDSPDKQIIDATTALVGVHIGGDRDVTFAAAAVSVEDMGAWAASSVLETVIGAPDGKLDGSGSISVSRRAAESVLVGETEYRLEHSYGLPFLDRRTGGTVGRMRDTAFMRIVPREPISWRDAVAAVALVQDLIAFATHRAAGVIWLRLELAGPDPHQVPGRPARPRYAEAIYSPSAVGKQDATAVSHHHVFFTCESLRFEEVMPRWCEARERLHAATNMILGLRYAPARYVEANLLTAVGAAEVLHRGLRIDERPFPPEEFERLRNAMLEQVPEKHRARFKGSLRNDPTLRDRLYALAARPDQDAIALLIPDVDRWARRTTKARNDLAHEGRTPNHSLEELAAVVEVTTAMVILNILHELGLPGQRQCEIVQTHPQLRLTANLAREQLTAPANS
ncbi:hypothetical protein LK09_14695 [Microbacterium mangrovi]|uniref:Uncharacterized protein n=1 Tax=Microbacterium mangrovi TaxID=1348253 RepID=A0A0B2A4T1_9MICO|nr:HEPN domain-containing protein [Microbacterium mangrovi]KHK96583.1 hypothetical protein LK09_14695 [Microbacterium mangrovi]